MKKCPYCAEEIQTEAILCRYCGREFGKKREAINQDKWNIFEKLIAALFIILYIWTIFISFSSNNVSALVLTLFTPVLAQVYWFFYMGINYTFVTFYHLLNILLIFIIIIYSRK